MAERYERIFANYDKYYAEGAPAIIVARALLIDSKKDCVVAQLKFQNIVSQRIQAVNVRIETYDSFGKKLQGLEEYQYTDLDVTIGEYWGQDVAIILPNILTRTIDVTIKSIIFSDKSVWECNERLWNKLEKPTQLSTILENDELVKQFKIEYGQDADFFYLVDKGVWHCVCGAINKEEADECYSCKVDKNTLNTYDFETLRKTADTRVVNEKIKAEEIRIEEERQEKIREQEKEKRTKKITITVMVLIAIFSLLYITVIRTIVSKNYFDKALVALEKKDIVTCDMYIKKAKKVLIDINDYNVLNDKYLLVGCELVDANNFQEANEYFKSVNGNYKTEIAEIYTNKVVSLLLSEEPPMIIQGLLSSLFENVEDREVFNKTLSDRIEKTSKSADFLLAKKIFLVKLKYNKDSSIEETDLDSAKNIAMHLVTMGDYSSAKELFDKIGQYICLTKNDEEIILETISKLISQKEYDDVRKLLDVVTDFDYFLEENVNFFYNVAVEQFEAKEYDMASVLFTFSESCSYLDSKDYLFSIYVINNIINGQISIETLEAIHNNKGRKDLLTSYQYLIDKAEKSLTSIQGCYKGGPYYYYISGYDTYWGDETGYMYLDMIYIFASDMWKNEMSDYLYKDGEDIQEVSHLYKKITIKELPSSFGILISSQNN